MGPPIQLRRLRQPHEPDGVLRSDPESSECEALISSFLISKKVYYDKGGEYPTNGALFCIHWWYPMPPWGGSNPGIANPFGFRVSPFVTYVTPLTPYGRVGSTAYYVQAWFYKPADPWFYSEK